VRTFLICIGSLLLAAPVHAQARRWSVTIEGGELRFGGTSADTSSDGIGAFRPYRPTTLGLRLERGGSVRVGLGLVYGTGPAALIGPDLTITARTDPLTLIELAPSVSWRVLAVGSGSLRIGGGPLLDYWSWSPAPARWRIGAEGSARLEAPLGSASAVVVRAGLARTSSILEEEDLPAHFARRPSWRSSLALGLLLRR
jgi:hypothetical protein